MGLNSMSRKRPCDRIKIQYMSDLHLERRHYEFHVRKAAPLLVLGGDIGRFHDFKRYSNFIRKQCDLFDQVLLVAGNHEFYGSSHGKGLESAKRLVDDPDMGGKFQFLNRARFDIARSDVIVLGCKLHSHISPDCVKITNDFRRIRNWAIEQHNSEHESDVKWLREALEEIAKTEPKKRVVIVTHYAPSFEGTCHPRQENNAASQCFCSHTLREFRRWEGAGQVTHWLFGHTHWNAKFHYGPTTVVSNQLMDESRDLSFWQKHFLYRAFDDKVTIQA